MLFAISPPNFHRGHHSSFQDNGKLTIFFGIHPFTFIFQGTGKLKTLVGIVPERLTNLPYLPFRSLVLKLTKKIGFTNLSGRDLVVV